MKNFELTDFLQEQGENLEVFISIGKVLYPIKSIEVYKNVKGKEIVLSNQRGKIEDNRHEFKENIQELIEISSNYVKMINRVIPINEDDQKFVDELASKYLSALKKEAIDAWNEKK